MSATKFSQLLRYDRLSRLRQLLYRSYSEIGLEFNGNFPEIRNGNLNSIFGLNINILYFKNIFFIYILYLYIVLYNPIISQA